MSISTIQQSVDLKLNAVRALLGRFLQSGQRACLTCSFQAEDVLLTKLALEYDARLPILFLDTGYHFPEIYDYRDRLAAEWKLNLVNLQPVLSVAEQEAQQGKLYQSAPDLCCKQRKVQPLFAGLAAYDLWITGLRREQAKSRAALEVEAPFQLPGNHQILKLAPLALWSTRDLWYACESLAIPRLSLYDKGYTSIGCAPCTSLPAAGEDPRSGRWGGHKVECGIHIEADPN